MEFPHTVAPLSAMIRIARNYDARHAREQVWRRAEQLGIGTTEPHGLRQRGKMKFGAYIKVSKSTKNST